jgi:hypothetical protein
VRDGVDRGRVHDGNSVPARLNLDREMVLETTAGFGMVEDLLEGGVLEGGSVDVSGDPVRFG